MHPRGCTVQYRSPASHFGTRLTTSGFFGYIQPFLGLDWTGLDWTSFLCAIGTRPKVYMLCCYAIQVR